jgi:four helix bundle protein
MCEGLSKSRTADIIARQLIRSSCSVGANYRAACVAKSKLDFIAKLGIVHEEIDELVYWLELLVESKIILSEQGEAAIKEAAEILSIIVASLKTAKERPRRRD